MRYIPHANNRHNWRTILFVFFVTLVSMGGAYFVHAYPKNIKPQTTEAYAAPSIVAEPTVAVQNSVFVPEKPELMTQKNDVTLETPKEDVAAPVLTKAERSKDSLTGLQEAKQYAQPQILIGKYIDISLGYQNMVIFEDGKALDAYQISSGKKGLDTPIGTFKVENKSPKAWSKSYGLWMPNWMAIVPSGKIGIHELPIWPGGYQEGANHLGTPVSHGCVRLGTAAAKWVYQWAEIGTPVIVHE